jgi:integrase/recombinase XerD
MGKLQERMNSDLCLKGYSVHTCRAYLRYVRRFAQHFMRSPAEMGEEEIRAFLLHLIQNDHADPILQKAHICALKFFYRTTLKRPEVVANIPNPRIPKRLPAVLSPEEVLAIFEAIEHIKYKTIVATAYGSGLRVSEVCALRSADIDSRQMRIYVCCGKGGKDRYALLSPLVLELLRECYRQIRPKGIYLFPGQKADRHISPGAVSQVFKKAVRKIGLQKKATMHSLRHSFASHLLEKGTDIRFVQALLGHASIRSTVRYTHVSHASLLRVESPWDALQKLRTQGGEPCTQDR